MAERGSRLRIEGVAPAPIKLFRAAGLVIAVLSAIPPAARALRGPRLETLAFALPLAIFVVMFLYSLGDSVPKAGRRAALLVESVAAIAFAALVRGGFAGVFMVVVAAQAPFIVGSTPALAIVALQTLSLAVIDGSRTSVVQTLAASGGYLGFQLFAAGAAVLAEREAKARAELALVNAELLATREAFAGTARTAERLRIARDLHDTMGHRLTALRLQLEVAKNSADEQQRNAIETSIEISSLLLEEVREVVSSMRRDTPIDLETVLSRLALSVPRPKITLAIDPAVHESDAALMHAMVRFVQEAVTNAARHSRAETLVIEIKKEGDAVRITARDDGEGSGRIREGNGLRGLRERLEELGGSLEIDRPDGRGLMLRALVPTKAGPS
jgi:signal transduction histidine kinase